jgi:hypothetical protein
MDEFTKELKEFAAGLHDGMGGHADYCAELMERAALMIAKLQSDYTAQSLALKAAKAMQQAETERADANGWIRAIDEDMVCAHIGIADGSDDYATAKKKLNDLIAWHVAVATDPAVNGGYKLVPIEPTLEMLDAAERIDWSDEDVRGNCCNQWNAMLSATNHATIQPLSTKE